jgi:hypothetical protein
VNFSPANQTKTITSAYRAIRGATRASFAVYAMLLDFGIVPIGLVALRAPTRRPTVTRLLALTASGTAVVCVIVSHTGVVVPLSISTDSYAAVTRYARQGL